MKRILSGIFAALLILCALPVAAFAEQQPSDIDPITVQPISASILLHRGSLPWQYCCIEWQYRSFGRYCRWGKVNRRKMGSSVAFAR